MRIIVKVKPNARENSVMLSGDNFYEVKVTVPPEKGKANRKVIELLAKHFRISKSSVILLNGETNKEKLFEIDKR
jgi:uncharacterized protein (TIGR00251 family)